MYPINVVEKETKISKYLLRMWERRYPFPRPERDSKGERLYTNEDVEKLKLIKLLMQEGYRPSKIIGQSLMALQELFKSFDNSRNSNVTNVVILVTGPELLDEVQLALKNYNVKQVLRINNKDDVERLSL
jgi:DNA-binding transcriptional MerR regulator